MTAFGSVHTAVEAMKIGAFDYVQKPFEIEEMELKVEKAIEHRRLRHEIEYLRHTQQDIYDFDRIVGASGALGACSASSRRSRRATPPCSFAAKRAPARSSSPARSITTRCAPAATSSR